MSKLEGPAGFTSKRRAKAVKASTQSALVAIDNRRMPFTPVWHGGADRRMLVAQSAAMPISEVAMAKVFADIYGGKMAVLKQACESTKGSKFTIPFEVLKRDEILDRLPKNEWPLLWGCGAAIRNVCPLLRTPLHEAIVGSLSRWSDSLSGEDKVAANMAIMLRGVATPGR